MDNTIYRGGHMPSIGKTYRQISMFVKHCLENPDEKFVFATAHTEDQAREKFKRMGFEVPANATILGIDNYTENGAMGATQ